MDSGVLWTDAPQVRHRQPGEFTIPNSAIAKMPLQLNNNHNLKHSIVGNVTMLELRKQISRRGRSAGAAA